jgi:hypothetical protein
VGSGESAVSCARYPKRCVVARSHRAQVTARATVHQAGHATLPRLGSGGLASRRSQQPASDADATPWNDAHVGACASRSPSQREALAPARGKHDPCGQTSAPWSSRMRRTTPTWVPAFATRPPSRSEPHAPTHEQPADPHSARPNGTTPAWARCHSIAIAERAACRSRGRTTCGTRTSADRGLGMRVHRFWVGAYGSPCDGDPWQTQAPTWASSVRRVRNPRRGVSRLSSSFLGPGHAAY